MLFRVQAPRPTRPLRSFELALDTLTRRLKVIAQAQRLSDTKQAASNGRRRCPLRSTHGVRHLLGTASRGRRVRRVAERPRHILRRRRRFRNDGRGVWVRQPVQRGVRDEHGGAEHGAVQRRRGVRVVLRAALRQRRDVVPAGLHHRDGDQLLPAQLRPPQRRRRLVQPSSPPLRHGRAGLPPHRPVPRRHRARLLPPGAVREEGGNPVHHQRALVLQPGAGDERGRRRRRPVGVDQGVAHRVAGHVAQLGPELAEQLLPRRPEPLLPGHLQRRPHRHQQQRRPRRLELRPDLRRRPVLAAAAAAAVSPTPTYIRLLCRCRRRLLLL